MKQYYGNENYIKSFYKIEKKEKDRGGLKIFLSDMSDHI
jgi:hypothetical protein